MIEILYFWQWLGMQTFPSVKCQVYGSTMLIGLEDH